MKVLKPNAISHTTTAGILRLYSDTGARPPRGCGAASFYGIFRHYTAGRRWWPLSLPGFFFSLNALIESEYHGGRLYIFLHFILEPGVVVFSLTLLRPRACTARSLSLASSPFFLRRFLFPRLLCSPPPGRILLFEIEQ